MNTRSTPLTVSYDVLHLMKIDSEDKDILHEQHPLTFSAITNIKDDPTFKEDMESLDREGFLEAIHLEIEQLESMK